MRQFRNWLINNDFSEAEAHAAVEKLRQELLTITPAHDEQIRRAASEKIARYLALKRLGSEANLADIEHLSRHYYLIIVSFSTSIGASIGYSYLGELNFEAHSLLGKISHEITEFFREDRPPVGSAALPSSEKETASEGSTPLLIWPVAGRVLMDNFWRLFIYPHSERRIVKSTAPGLVTVANCERYQDDRFYYVAIKHAGNVETHYGGRGNIHVEKGMNVARGEEIAKLPYLSWGRTVLYLQVENMGEAVDPRPYFPPRGIGHLSQMRPDQARLTLEIVASGCIPLPRMTQRPFE